MNDTGVASAGLRARATAARGALGRTTVAASLTRAREIDLGSCALVLAAQQLMATIPLLVVLSALHPAGTTGNFGAQLSRYLGLTATATNQLRAVFAGREAVKSAATAVGLILLAFFALGAAQAHQRVYELAWRLPPQRAKTWRRRMRWVVGMLGYVALLAATGRLLAHWQTGHLGFIAICAPITALFYWWSQRTLLAGRIAARSLLPGALMIATAVTFLLLLSPLLISAEVTSSVRQFGSIGTTLVLAAWLLILSTLVVAGTIAGATVVSRRQVQKTYR